MRSLQENSLMACRRSNTLRRFRPGAGLQMDEFLEKPAQRGCRRGKPGTGESLRQKDRSKGLRSGLPGGRLRVLRRFLRDRRFSFADIVCCRFTVMLAKSADFVYNMI